MTYFSIVIPDDVMQRLEGAWTDVPQRMLEAFAVQAYRMGILTSAEVQRVLNLRSRWDVDALLTQNGVYWDYTEEDLEEDIRTLETLQVRA